MDEGRRYFLFEQSQRLGGVALLNERFRLQYAEARVPNVTRGRMRTQPDFGKRERRVQFAALKCEASSLIVLIRASFALSAATERAQREDRAENKETIYQTEPLLDPSPPVTPPPTEQPNSTRNMVSRRQYFSTRNSAR